MKGPKPTVKAILLCDYVLRDVTGKYSIIGIFRQIHCAELPVFHSRFGVYLMLGGLNGTYDFEMEFAEPTEEQVIGKALLKGVKWDKPLTDFETGINLPGLGFEREGTHELRVKCNGELLHVDTISVSLGKDK